MLKHSLFVFFALTMGCAGGGGPDATVSDARADRNVRDARGDADPEFCQGRADDTPCDSDGDGCTVDTCQRDRCVAGGPVDCSEGGQCGGSCVATSATSFTCDGAVEGCTIGGVCVPPVTLRPDNACEQCIPEESTSGWTAVEGSCDDDNECTINDTCAEGVCKGEVATDDNEPNESLSNASELGDIRDTDSFPGGTVIGLSSASGDNDWFTYTIEDRFGGSVNPRVELRNLPADQNLDVCVLIDCENADFDGGVECGSGSTEAPAFYAQPGCCSTNVGDTDEDVSVTQKCEGTDDSLTVHVLVYREAGADSCAPYEMRWGDN